MWFSLSSPLADYGTLRAPLCGSSCGDQLTDGEVGAIAIARQAPRRGAYDSSTSAGWDANFGTHVPTRVSRWI